MMPSEKDLEALIDSDEIEVDLPLLPVRDTVVFPRMLTPLFVGRDRSLAALEASLAENSQLVVVTQKDPDLEDPTAEDLYTVGAEVVVGRVLKMPDGSNNILVQGYRRIEILEFLQEEPYPIVRARIVSINGTPIDRAKESRRRGDNLGRPFNLTYRERLMEDERILHGETLFAESHPDIQVSVLDTVAEIHPMAIGDRIAFNIQGLPLEATIVSIRTREKETMKPFFYFVFQREVLEGAPQSLFTAVRVPEQEVAALQSRIAARFPNVSALDVSAAITVISGVMRRLSGVVRFFGLFSMLAGILIIVSSVFATRLDRMQEAVYFKILGAGQGFVRRVFALGDDTVGGDEEGESETEDGAIHGAFLPVGQGQTTTGDRREIGLGL